MATVGPKRSIFRSKTLQTYIQSREKSVLPRLVAPPVFALCWVVLTLLIIAGVIIWSERIPVYITGSGIVTEPDHSLRQEGEATAVLLFPLSEASHLQQGLPIQIQLGQVSPMLDCHITTVSQHPLNPGQIQQQYRLEVAGPAIVVTARLGSAIPASLYEGSHVQAQLQVGSQSLLLLFPILNSL